MLQIQEKIAQAQPTKKNFNPYENKRNRPAAMAEASPAASCRSSAIFLVTTTHQNTPLHSIFSVKSVFGFGFSQKRTESAQKNKLQPVVIFSKIIQTFTQNYKSYTKVLMIFTLQL